MYLQPLQGQHHACWSEYCDKHDDAKKSFSGDSLPVKEIRHAHFRGRQIEKICLLDALIIEVIIGNMPWNADYVESPTHQGMMSSFINHLDESEDSISTGSSPYKIQIKHALHWMLIIDYLCASVVIRQGTRILNFTRDRTGLALIGSSSDPKMAKYVRFVCAINLQQGFDLLDRAWAFVVVMEMSTHQSTSSLDMPIRLYAPKRRRYQYALLALAVYERNTGEVVFSTGKKAFIASCGSWEHKIIDISTDGECKMTSHVSGVATCFQQAPSLASFVFGMEHTKSRSCHKTRTLLSAVSCSRSLCPASFPTFVTGSIFMWLCGRRGQLLPTHAGRRCATSGTCSKSIAVMVMTIWSKRTHFTSPSQVVGAGHGRGYIFQAHEYHSQAAPRTQCYCWRPVHSFR